MTILSNIQSQSTNELMRYFASDGSENEVWLDEAAIQIADSNPDGVLFLLSCLDNASERKIRAILIGISSVSPMLSAPLHDAVVQRALGFLNDPRPMILAEAVDTLRQLGCQAARPTILGLLTHDSPFVVGAVLRYMAAHSPDEAVPLLMQALDAKEPIVRENAIDELEEMDYRAALPLIRRLLNDPDKHVRQAAETAVCNLEELSADD